MRFLFLLALSGCDLTPPYVDTKDIEQAAARGAWPTVCKGLEMREERIRRYAAEQLWKNKAPAEDQACICDHIGTEDNGWDAAIAEGLATVDDDKIVGCFAKLVAKPDLKKRTEAVVALAQTTAPIARKTLAEVALADGDVKTRWHAIAAIAGMKDFEDTLVKLLDSDEKELRAAAAKGLSGFKDRAIVDRLIAIATGDKDGEVRAAALVAVKASGNSKAQDMVCRAMLEDESAIVREAAVRTFRATRRDSAVKCLRAKALKEESSAAVRDALLEVLKSSPNDNAALILCDAIPFWMRTYVKDDIPDKIPGTMIVKTQNDRDWERSYECFQRAYRNSSGYSCFAKMHVGLWLREVGGKNYVPSCPGYENTDGK
jgi:HEAT repeat protein